MGESLLCSRRPSFVDALAIGIVSQVKDGDNLASLIMYFLVESHKTFLGVL